MKVYIGIDIGGTHSRVSWAFEENEKLININIGEVYSTKSYDVYQMLEMLLADVKRIQRDTFVDAIGISCGGPLDSEKGIICSPPNLPGWDNIYIKEYFERNTNIPTKLCNDANAYALAEWYFGASKGHRSSVFLTFGTGMGAGLILDGRLYEGSNGMAGEIGHIRLTETGPTGYGKSGSFEGFCSGNGMAQYGKLLALEKIQKGESIPWIKDINSIESIDIGMAAKQGDSFALEVFEKVGLKLGQGISILIDIINPSSIVIGSIFTRNEEFIRPAMEKVVLEESLSLSNSIVQISKSLLGEKIGDYAALTVAKYYSENGEVNEK